jgi:hypothetical protein
MHTETLASRARSYIAALDLPPPPRTRGSFLGQPAAEPALPDASAPALAVGPNLVEFAPGADPSLRQATTDALLLAQLAADKAEVATPDAWYAAHHGVLTRLGFRSSGLTRTTQDFSATNADLHEAILPVITAAFAGAAIPAVVIATLQQLSAASEGRPWIRLFERESRRFSARQFQVTVVEGDPSAQTVNMLGFALDVAQEQAQILFFRHARDTAAVGRIESRFSAENAALADIAADLAAKLAARRHAYLAALEI